MSSLATSKRWEVLSANPSDVERIVSSCHVSPLVARVMAARGITNAEQAQAFLNPSIDRDWQEPLLIPGMKEAADRIQQALERHERICVFGDFDVDGISATCLLAEGLRALGGNVSTLIPRRFGEGYGLSVAACNRAAEESDPQLVVTVDNGIAAKSEVEWMLSRRIDVVITDHHEPSDLVPTGVPVCDPKLEKDNPCRELAGVGVALKLVCELGRRLGKPDLWRSFTDMCALGTVSDMMLLTGENRSLVADGIERLRQTTRPGLLALAAVARIDLARLTADTLPFSIVPRLNASGRMGQADLALDLLMSTDPGEAQVLASKLDAVNQERRETEAALSARALEMADAMWSDDSRCVVLAGEGWHEGVKGIVASRVVNRYHVPAIMFSVSEGIARGSGRSVGRVDLFHAVEQCSDLLERFGGHAGAVGVTILPQNIDAFRERLGRVLSQLPPEDFEDKGEVTSVVGLEELNVPTISSLSVLQPFGQGNKMPFFAVQAVSMISRSRVGGAGDHLRFCASDGISSVPAIMFRAPDIERASSYEGSVDLVFEAVVEEWQGQVKPKLMVRDIIYRSDDEVPANDEPQEEAGAAAPVAATRALRTELSSLSSDELTARLVQRFIGNHELLPAQAQALSTLDHGRSTLCVMATGRGKSLIFHVHAAREALLHNCASVFVYPLRALVNDQAHHLSDAFSELGVSVRTLTGETPQDVRDEVFLGLATGAVDVVLTTPEFLAIHVRNFADARRVGFLVVDESHHAGLAKSGSREAYLSLPAIRDALGMPTCLSVTATATSRVAREICDLTSVRDERDVIVDESVRDNLRLRDARGSATDRDAVLVNLVDRGEKCVCYVNSRAESRRICNLLRRRIPEHGGKIAFYNADLPRETRLTVERAFRDGKLSCIVSTSAFGEGVNLPDIRHVVLYHLPFGRVEFNQMAGRAGRDGKTAWIHLLYDGSDARTNEYLLQSAAPTRDLLATFWRALALAEREGGVVRSDDSLVEFCLRIDPTCGATSAFVDAGIGIFSELGLVSVSGVGEERVVERCCAGGKVELNSSIRFQEGQRLRDEFEEFRNWALTSSPDELLESVNRPIAPSFGRRVN